MPWATASDGVRLYYEVHGPGAGGPHVGGAEPLLLISGQAGDRHVWDAVRDGFAARHRVIVFDHRGTGDSDKPAEPPYSTRGFAADAVAILDSLGVPRAHAYGVSMGGRICQWLGIEHADRIGSLVLGCTTPGDRHGVARPAHVDAVLNAERTAKTYRALLELTYTPQWIERHPELLTDPPPPIPEYARALHYGASQGHDVWDLLPRIDRPVLVIHGSDDQINPTANAALLAERIPGARLHIVEGARHGYFDEFAAEATSVVLDFLSGHPLAG